MHWIALQALPDALESRASAGTLTALAWWSLQFTPKVVSLRDAVLLEVASSAHLWGGPEALHNHVRQASAPLMQVRLAYGETSLLALGRVRLAQAWTASVDALPLSVLDAAQAHLETLARMGCTRWGQLRALPRAGVARRFGAALLQALDQAYGVAPDVYPWLRLPDVFEAALELPSPVDDATALLFGARRLLVQLQAWLAARQRAVLGLELRWDMDARRGLARQGAVVLRLAVPASDTAHVQTLLAERLAQQTLPAPALCLHLRSLETVVLSGRSASWLPDPQSEGDSVRHMVERLSARLGPEQVLRWQARSDHRPQCMQVWASAQASGLSWASGRPAVAPAVLWPSALLESPQALPCRHGQPRYHGALRLLLGPQRIESAWWALGTDTAEHPIRRDYFMAHSARCGLLWIFQDAALCRDGAQQTAPWYLHGFFA